MQIYSSFALIPGLQVNLTIIKLIFIKHMLGVLPRTQCRVLHILHLTETLRPSTGQILLASLPDTWGRWCAGALSPGFHTCSGPLLWPLPPSLGKCFVFPQHPLPKRSTATLVDVNDCKARLPGFEPWPPLLTSREGSGKFSTVLPLSFVTSKAGTVMVPASEACHEK